MPKLQISAFVSYSLPLEMTSGAIQYGVPTKVVRLDAAEGRRAETPKSQSRTRFGADVIRMLAAEHKRGARNGMNRKKSYPSGQRTFDISMDDPVLVQESEGIQYLSGSQAYLQFGHGRSSCLESRWKDSSDKTRSESHRLLTNVRTLPPSASSITIHTFGPSVQHP